VLLLNECLLFLLLISLSTQSGNFWIHPCILLSRRKVNYGGNNQNLILFTQENAVSGDPNSEGTNQFLKLYYQRCNF
jgi:hypothetical protein